MRRTFVTKNAAHITMCALLFGSFNYDVAIKNVVRKEAWNWRIKQQVADSLLLEVILLMKGEMNETPNNPRT